MSNEARRRLCEDLDRIVSYYSQEYELTYLEAIGCLEIKKQALLMDLFGEDDDDVGD